jgi:2-keto-4-pentenoate hydratase/2-oxohepta-3-ene-1,7-dioic acid hydratase in catechol pathway
LRLVRTAEGWGEVEGSQIWVLEGDISQGFSRTSKWSSLDGTTLLAPVMPSKIVAVAANYPKHATEMGHAVPSEPRLFLKAPSAIVGPGDPIKIPPITERVDPEGELAIVIGQTLKRATPDSAMKAVFGYTCLNDVTCRDFQKKDGIFGRAKSFDSFCPVGPWVVTDIDPNHLQVTTSVNGQLRASGNTSEMHFSVTELLVFISSVMTLLPGDVVSTGTPPGVAPIHSGDMVEIEVEGIGVLRNPVLTRSDPK